MASGGVRQEKRTAGQRSLFWRQLRKNQLAVAGGVVVILLGLVAALLATLKKGRRAKQETAPPLPTLERDPE